MNVFIVDLAHKPGELAKAAEAIAQKGINITAFSGSTCGGSGSVAFLTNDEMGTRKALGDAGYRAKELEVVTASIEDKPGALAKTARKLAEAGVNIEFAMPTGMSGGKATLAFATDNPSKAKSIIGAGQPVGVASR
jgi:hypothetical protein